MRMLSAILCRAFGHKPYTHPHIVWKFDEHDHLDGRPVMITRCTRCSRELDRRPMLAGKETIEA